MTSRKPTARQRALLEVIASTDAAGLPYDGPGHRAPNRRTLAPLVNAGLVEIRDARLFITEAGRALLSPPPSP